ncbi:proteasome-activating nucleotidase [Halosimplex pelagicum]|uniref:Proteasome-activating nucleotidase n=1 Tax=Halosimplex pelagicum TaxID=869886 RepID=A0A7D5TSN0_9EURY|nr:proteasome-activating nucleotidase [Halosimplex pelagicum]QLH82112.1 proteasome-activating nucleotidase [Halosimplex pelagicum]
MTETTEEPNLPNGGTADAEQMEELQEEVELLREQNQEMEEKLLDANAEKNRVEQKLDRVTRENEKLKQNPLFIATVEEVTDDGVIVRQHGNNQEALTEITEELREDLEAGDRVTINNQLAVVDKIDAETDARAQAMHVDASPDVTYDEIGGIENQMQEVRETIEMPLEDPEQFNAVGIDPPSGVLLHGPPGTGKTMLAKAVANQTDATFIKMAGSELVHKFIGEGAKLVRDIFEVAREEEPAVLFIDEIDAIAAERTDSKTSGDAEVQRTMMQLLSEMDGFDDRGDVRIIAATNRFDMLDDAILRPGRFDRLIEVPKPDVSGRENIFQIHAAGMNTEDLDYNELAAMAESASGADIEAICTEAGMFAIRDSRTTVTMQDFKDAHAKIRDANAEEGAEQNNVDDISRPSAFA